MGANEDDSIETAKLTLKDFCKNESSRQVGLQQNLVKISVFIPFSVTPQAKTAFFISISLTAMYIISGTAVLMDFSAEIFARTGSSISSKSSSLLVSVTKLTGNLIFLVVVEKLRRKVCFYAFEFSRVTFHGFWLTFSDFLHWINICVSCFFLAIWHILLTMDASTGARLDARLLCCMHQFQQWNRLITNAISHFR